MSEDEARDIIRAVTAYNTDGRALDPGAVADADRHCDYFQRLVGVRKMDGDTALAMTLTFIAGEMQSRVQMPQIVLPELPEDEQEKWKRGE